MEKDENNVKLFENVMNNNIFKFLVRAYYSKTINSFKILKLLSKILSFKISKLLKLKYILFFLNILKRFTINESVFNQNINPIINEVIGDVLTRKADYVIIIQYAIFLVQIGEIDFALSRLQIFSTDLRFMNNGELVFYKGLISLYANIDEFKNFITIIEKSLSFIKKNNFIYCEWVINFLIYKGLFSDLLNFLKKDKLREYINKNDPQKAILINSLNDVDFLDLNKKISIVAKELEFNPYNFAILEKFRDLVDNYYEEFLPNASKINFMSKLINLDKNYPLVYLNFLYTYFINDYLHDNCHIFIKENLSGIENDELIRNFFKIQDKAEFMLMYLKFLIEILYKNKIFFLMKRIFCRIENKKSESYQVYSKRRVTLKDSKLTLAKLKHILQLVDYNSYVVLGINLSNDILLSKYNDFFNKIFQQIS
jgi:hypothetical protein